MGHIMIRARPSGWLRYAAVIDRVGEATEKCVCAGLSEVRQRYSQAR